MPIRFAVHWRKVIIWSLQIIINKPRVYVEILVVLLYSLLARSYTSVRPVSVVTDSLQFHEQNYILQHSLIFLKLLLNWCGSYANRIPRRDEQSFTKKVTLSWICSPKNAIYFSLRLGPSISFRFIISKITTFCWIFTFRTSDDKHLDLIPKFPLIDFFLATPKYLPTWRKWSSK